MSSVTFPTAIGGDGSTVTDDDNATTGLRNGGWRTRFIPCFTNLVNIANYIVSYTAQTSTFAAPPPMGSTTPNTGAFTRVTVTGSTAPANGLYLPATNALGFATNSTERVRIDSSGNVGIGTSSPNIGAAGTALTILGSSTNRANLELGSTTASASSVFGQAAGYNGATLATLVQFFGDGATDSGAIKFFTKATGGSITERVRLDSSGNLGLGVTPLSSGTTAFEVKGGGDVAFQGNGNISANAYYSSGSYKYATSSTAVRYSMNGASAGGHAWFTAPSGTAGNAISFTQAMTLDASGRLYVGTTTQASGYDMKLVLSNDSGTNNWSVGPRVAVPGAFYVAANTTYGVYLSSPTVTAWASASDERLKTDLKPIENAAQKVSTLRAVTGRFKTDEEGVSRSFLIAQDVQAVLPEAVDSEDPEKLGVRYTETIPLLVAAIQELSAELNELKQKVNA